MQMQRLLLPDAAATAAAARALAVRLHAGCRLALIGPMGAGKTAFVRGLVAALGGDPAAVASPTYTLLHRYEAELPVVHVDAWRLDGPSGFAALGADELAADGVLAVEWADRLDGALGEDWRLLFAHAGHGRSLDIAGPPGTAPLAIAP